MMNDFSDRLAMLETEHHALVARPNRPVFPGNGIFVRYENPVVTASHAPLSWRYDLDPATNPFLMERMGINAAFNAGAILHEGKYVLVVRVEGADRKSFFAVAESPNGVENFKFRDYPVELPQTENPDVNVYDMRLTSYNFV